MQFKQTGFTIIELLMTIAIIGILAAVILGSLNDARQSGINAKIQTEMDGIAKRAEIENTTQGHYNGVCGSNGISTSTVILKLIDSVNSFASSTVVCNSDTGDYAVSVPLNTVHWCIDNLGAKKEIPSPLVTSPPELSCP